MLSAAYDRGAYDHLELVHKAGTYRLRGEFRTVNRDVVLGADLESPDRIRIELPLDPRPRAARLGEGPGTVQTPTMNGKTASTALTEFVSQREASVLKYACGHRFVALRQTGPKHHCKTLRPQNRTVAVDA